MNKIEKIKYLKESLRKDIMECSSFKNLNVLLNERYKDIIIMAVDQMRPKCKSNEYKDIKVIFEIKNMKEFSLKKKNDIPFLELKLEYYNIQLETIHYDSSLNAINVLKDVLHVTTGSYNGVRGSYAVEIDIKTSPLMLFNETFDYLEKILKGGGFFNEFNAIDIIDLLLKNEDVFRKNRDTLMPRIDRVIPLLKNYKAMYSGYNDKVLEFSKFIMDEKIGNTIILSSEKKVKI